LQFYQCSSITLYFSQFQDLTGSAVPIEFVATSRLPTAHGEFKITVFQDPNLSQRQDYLPLTVNLKLLYFKTLRLAKNMSHFPKDLKKYQMSL